jgi:hypothetical protein
LHNQVFFAVENYLWNDEIILAYFFLMLLIWFIRQQFDYSRKLWRKQLTGVDWDQKSFKAIGFIRATETLQKKPHITLQKHHNPWKSLNFPETVVKYSWNLYKSPTFLIRSLHFSENVFKNLVILTKASHLLTKASTFLKTNLKSLKIFQNVPN